MSSPDRPLGVGIIGAGFMGQTYARTVQTLISGARLAGIAEGSRAPGLAKDYDVPHFAHYEDLVAHPSVDAVFIATPHACHAEQALAAAQAGKHLLIDKPMACSVDACDAILDTCREKGLKCAVTHTLRRRVGFAKTKTLIESGQLGRVLEIRTYQIVPGGLSAVPAWQMEPANIGFLFGHGIHNFDAIRALTGQDITAVFAKCRSLTGMPVEATTDALVTTADGGVHYLFCSFEIPKPGFPRSEVAIRMVCEKGLIDMDPYKETRVSFDGGDWQTLAVQPPIDWAGNGFLDPNRLQSYSLLIQDLVDAIRENREPAVSGWEGRQAVAAVLAAYESSRTGREVRPE